MAMRLTSRQFKELMGPNGDQHELLGGHKQSSSRRNLFSSQSSTRVNSHQSTSSFYRRSMPCRSAGDDDEWQQGDYIVPPQNSAQPDIYALLSDMQSAITTEIKKVQSSVDSLSSRVDKLEDDVMERVLNTSVSSSSPSTDTEGSSKQRKRRISPDISNTIRTIHNKLSEEKQLKVNEPIDGHHNKAVVAAVEAELTDDCSPTTVRSVLATYRQSLCRKNRDSDTTTQRRIMRSRQQRKYERRSCRVLESEQEMWEDVNPSMMSDEEDVGNNTFRIHRQEWCSQEFSDFLQEPDRRADAVMKKAHPRRNRIVGTPLRVSAPTTTKEWMVRSESREGSPSSFN